VVGLFPCGSQPLSVAYSPAIDQFGIACCASAEVYCVEPTTGAVVEVHSYDTRDGEIPWFTFNSSGEPAVLQSWTTFGSAYLHIGDDVVEIPYPAAHFDLHGGTGRAAVAMPRVDLVAVVEPRLCGDADDNDYVTAADAYVILNYIGSGPTPASCWAANVNGDNGISPSDGFHLLNYLGGGEPPLDCRDCEF